MLFKGLFFLEMIFLPEGLSLWFHLRRRISFPDFHSINGLDSLLQEPLVAEHMIQQDIMQKEQCVGFFKNIEDDDVPTSYVKRYYVIPRLTTTTKKAIDCNDYLIIPIVDTNMVLLKITKTCDNRGDTVCNCPHDIKQSCATSRTGSFYPEIVATMIVYCAAPG